MLLGTNIATVRKNSMKTQQKINSSTNLGLPIDMEKGRAFIGIHGVDRVVGSGPNAFSVEMVSGNSRIRGTGALGGSFGRGAGGVGERERHGGGWGL
jgi:hypothetical protein